MGRVIASWRYVLWAERYALALLFVGGATLLSWTLVEILGSTSYSAFYPAVVAAAAFGGLAPGLLATLASALVVDLAFTPPFGELNLGDPAELTRQVMFVTGAAAVSIVAAMLRSGRVRERRQANALRESEQRLRATFHNAGVGILEVDSADRFIAANDRVCQILGYRREELLGMSVHELTAPEDRERSDALNVQLHTGELDRLEYEKRYQRRDGSPLWAHVTVSAIRDPAGHFLRGIATVEDISERKRAEESIVEQNRFLNSVLESLTHPFYVIDARDYSIRMANTAAQFGELGPQTTCYELTHRSEAPCHQLGEVCPLEEVRASGKPFTAEHLHYDAHGNARICEIHAYPLFDRSGQVAQIIEYSLDVTARKRAEQALQHAKQAAEQANAAKDHFLAVLSHELRTPLTPVLATISLLEDEAGLPQETRHSLEVIRRNVELEARLIDDLLDLTRIVRGKVRLDKRPVFFREVILRTAEVCRPDIEARRLHFGVDLGSAAECVIEADAARLQQVFWNLLKNSIKFTSVGGCVGIRCHHESGAVVAEVNDTGEGIDPEALGRIFSAFEQADPAPQFGGLGLGLAISKAFVELHGGSIEAYSAGRGQGASFKVRLPILVSEGDQQPAPERSAESARGRRSHRILLVEDHGDTARVMKRLLERQGHEVETAGDVATALDLGLSEKVDLLISDLGLPDASGLDLMRELRQRRPDLKGIALSGYGMESDVQRSRDAGFADHLTKPVDSRTLQAAIDRVSS